MENNFIKLNKTREFGDVFNDTFAFLKQEAKPLGMALLIFALPLLLISSIASVYIQSQNINNVYGSANFDIYSYFTKISLVLVFVILAQNMLMVTVYSYFKLYQVKGPRNFDNSELFHEIKQNFLPCLVTAFILGILIAIGFVMCLLPGIYLGISLSMVIPVMIMENKGFADSFSRSFDLTHKQWWWTFLIIFVYIILAYMFMLILSLPGIILGIGSLLKYKNFEDSAINYPFYLVIYNAIVSLIATFFYAVLHIAIILQYYNIVEMYEGKTLASKIEQITQNDQA